MEKKSTIFSCWLDCLFLEIREVDEETKRQNVQENDIESGNDMIMRLEKLWTVWRESQIIGSCLGSEQSKWRVEIILKYILICMLVSVSNVDILKRTLMFDMFTLFQLIGFKINEIWMEDFYLESCFTLFMSSRKSRSLRLIQYSLIQHFVLRWNSRERIRGKSCYFLLNNCILSYFQTKTSLKILSNLSFYYKNVPT